MCQRPGGGVRIRRRRPEHQAASKPDRQTHGQGDGGELSPAYDRGQETSGQSEQDAIEQCQHRPPKVWESDSTHQQRQRQHREDGQQAVHGSQRAGAELSGNDLGAVQVGEEQQAQGTFAPFLADAVGRAGGGEEEAIQKRQNGKDGENLGCGPRVGEPVRDPQQPDQQAKENRRRQPARAVGRLLPRCGAKFAVRYR